MNSCNKIDFTFLIKSSTYYSFLGVVCSRISLFLFIHFSTALLVCLLNQHFKSDCDKSMFQRLPCLVFLFPQIFKKWIILVHFRCFIQMIAAHLVTVQLMVSLSLHARILFLFTHLTCSLWPTREIKLIEGCIHFGLDLTGILLQGKWNLIHLGSSGQLQQAGIQPGMGLAPH